MPDTHSPPYFVIKYRDRLSNQFIFARDAVPRPLAFYPGSRGNVLPA